MRGEMHSPPVYQALLYCSTGSHVERTLRCVCSITKTATSQKKQVRAKECLSRTVTRTTDRKGGYDPVGIIDS
jgi:hypothetical protein